jgi:Na+-translocating ferredoxin:NAD+ oxidoreductase RnfD subunit
MSSLPPNTKPARSLATRNAWTLVALAPGLAVMCVRDTSLPPRFAIALGAALVFESIALLLRRQPLAPYLREGSWLVFASVLVLCCSDRPPWQLACALFVGLVLARQAFGGLGRNLFHPVAAGVCFLVAIDPGFVTTVSHDFVLASAWMLGGVLLVRSRIVRWQAPAFLIAGVACGLLASGQHWFAITDARWWLAAVFIAGDPVTTAENPLARALAASLAGMLGAFFDIAILPFALLAMNAATPLLDAWMPPRPARVANP